MSFTYCTSGAIVNKAGINVNSAAAASGALLQQFSDEAEAFINAVTRVNSTGSYSGWTTATKAILQEATSCLAAMNLINYDMSGYTSRLEAQTMLDVLRDRAERCISLLNDDKVKTYIGIT